MTKKGNKERLMHVKLLDGACPKGEFLCYNGETTPYRKAVREVHHVDVLERNLST